jgi:AraC family transcriptional regulator
MSELEPPRFVDGPPLHIAGLNGHFDREAAPAALAAIPAQWQRFLPQMGQVPGRVGGVAYGVSYNGDAAGNFDYLCGVEVADPGKLTPPWSHVSLTPRRYAVFTHRGPLSKIHSTWQAIYQWLPGSGYKRARAPDFERYDENFDARSNSGFVEIWIPIES